MAAPPAWTIRRALWPPSSPSASRPSRSASKRTPSRSRSSTASRRLVAQDARGRLADGAAPGGDRVGAGGARGCRRRTPRPRGRPAPSSSRTPRAASPRRASRARLRARRVSAVYSPAAPAPTTATSCSRRSLHGTGTVLAMAAAPVFLEHPSSLRARHRARTRSSRRGSSRSSASSRRAAGSATSGSVAGGRARRCSRRVHPEAYVASIEAVSARGGGQLDLDTVMSAGLVRGRAARGGRRRAGSSSCWSRARRRPASAPTARPVTTRRAARAMGFCLFNNVAVAARHALDGLRARAGDDPRLGRPPRQRDERHLLRRPTRCCSSRSTSRRCTRAPGPRPTSGSARAAATRSTCRCRRGRTIDVYLSLVERCRRRRWRARSSRSCVLISAGYDAHVEDPLAECQVTDDGFAAMTRSMRAAVRDELGGAARVRARGRLRARRARAVGRGDARGAVRSRCRRWRAIRCGSCRSPARPGDGSSNSGGHSGRASRSRGRDLDHRGRVEAKA